MKSYLATLSLLLLPCLLTAQSWSYIYLQGDKETPFYVKLEGSMLPRYGKNYTIIPQLEPGPVRLQILFQQNKYPAQNFTVLVPQEGHRGFLVTKKDNVFALYDLEQHFYLLPGEKDRLPEPGDVAAAPAEPEPLPVSPEPVAPTPPKPAPAKPTSVKSSHTAGSSSKPELKKAAPVKDSGPVFIDNLVLDRNQNGSDSRTLPTDRTAGTGTTIPKSAGTTEINLESNTPPIPNSDCIGPMSPSAFAELMAGIKEKKPNDKLVVFFLKQTDDWCFTTRQVYDMAMWLETESVRFSFLKNVYPVVTDQQNFHLLEKYLFQTAEWKEYFRSIQ